MSVEIGKWSGVLNTHSHTYHTHTANRIQGKRKKNINNYYVVVVVLQYTCPIRISKLSNFSFTQKTHQRGSKVSSIYTRPINTFLQYYILSNIITKQKEKEKKKKKKRLCFLCLLTETRTKNHLVHSQVLKALIFCLFLLCFFFNVFFFFGGFLGGFGFILFSTILFVLLFL